MAKKKGKKAFSGSGGASGTGLAQSGGINHTFGGGKGGTAQTKPVTQGRKVGSGRLNNGLNYNVRSDGGDDSMTPFKGKIGTTPPLRGKPAKTVPVTVRPPAYRGGDR